MTSILNDLKTTNYAIPNQFHIRSVYPNPFNPVTTIEFSVPHNTDLSIRIMDLQGRVVDTILEKKYMPGNYSVQYNAGNLSSGVYFVELKSKSIAAY